jgi:RNA polymerase sigma factor (sigma-70 family)
LDAFGLAAALMLDVMEYYGLVVYTAREVRARLQSAGIDIAVDELVQEGAVGLLEAAQRFDPDRGVKFATFARPRIMGAIKDYLRRLDRLNQGERQQVKELGEVRERLAQELGRAAHLGEVAEAMGLEEGEVGRIDALRIIEEGEKDEEEEGVALWERAAVSMPDQERSLLGREVDECLEDTLDDTERSVLLFRFMQEWTLKEVGELLELGIETVRRRENSAQGKLRECLEGKGWEMEASLSLFR